jgi:hypothetical protein
VWRRSRLNRDDAADWQRAVAHAKAKQQKIGLPPDGYVYEAPSTAPPQDQRIKVVHHAATAFEPARRNPVVDRSTKAKRRRQQAALIAPAASEGFDWRRFLSTNWSDTFSHVWRHYRLTDQDLEGETGRILALSYKALLDERNARPNDAGPGPVSKRWDEILRALHTGIRPGPTPRTPPTIMPPHKAKTSRTRTSPEIRALFNKVLRDKDER